VRVELRLAPQDGAWPRNPTVLQGQALRVYASFLDVDGAALPANAVTGVVWTLARPGGPALQVASDAGGGIGSHSIGAANDVPGRWRAGISCTGPAAAVGEISWDVQAPAAPLAAAVAPAGLVLVTQDGRVLLTETGQAIAV
jgi:hypothetical protein